MELWIIIRIALIVILTIMLVLLNEGRDNVFYLFFSCEILFITGGLFWVYSSWLYTDIFGILMFIYIITLAAIKAAIGIILIVLFINLCNTRNCFKIK